MDYYFTLHALLLLILANLGKALFDLKVLKKEAKKFLKPRIVFYIGDTKLRRIKMKDTEQATASIELDDAKGYPVGGDFDQPAAWSIDDESIATLKPSDDGKSCLVVGQKPGNATLSVAAVLAGASFAGSCPVTVVAGDAATIKVTLGDASPQ